MTSDLRHCNAGADAPWKAIARAHQREGDPYLYAELFCELAAHHDGPHVDFKGYMGTDVHVWVRWTDGGPVTYAVDRACEVEDLTEDPVNRAACSLFINHSPGHSWEFTDTLHG